MELIIIAVAVIAVAVFFYYNRASNSADLNRDGRVDLADVKIGIETARQGIAADIVKVKTATRTAAKKIETKAKTTVKKPGAKKPAAKKPAVKKK
jgi:hypothetical protein